MDSTTYSEEFSTSVTGVPNDDATIERNKLSQEIVAAQSVQPTLGDNAVNNAVATTVNDDELANPTDSAFQIESPNDDLTSAAEGTTSTTIASPEEITTSLVDSYQATAAQATATPESQAQAAIGELPEEALISSQMEELTSGIENGDIPVWAQPAADAVEAQLAARGLTRSSVGQAALTNAIIQAAFPIAQGNAQAVQASFTQNVSNQQQANMVNASQSQQLIMANLANRQQAMLSNQASENATRQFNASSQNQTDQFMANLKTTVDTNNASRDDAMAQFESNQVDAMNQFNANLQFNSDKFNAENATLISQSNLQWKRQANTATTAAQNEANAQNAQNSYGLQLSATDKLWQEMRDNASWTFTAAQNDNQIKSSLIQASLSASTQKAIAELEAKQKSYQAIGSSAYNIFGDVVKAGASAIGSAVGGWLGF